MAKSNPFAVDEIAVVAIDTAKNIDETVNGSFIFTVNGFEDTLHFDKGTAFYHHKIQKSSFLYVKHVDEDNGSRGMLYYVYKHGHDLTLIHISWMLLVIIPLALIFLGYLFKRFIIIAAIALIVFLFFNYKNGLSIPTFFESIFDGLRHMF
ncbi:hypothetical protein MUY27_10115 [Mucilaginibacter sp. RS28]|uniref:Uncharacterized protein n=1 Tax=Mucilaginibacter straminoryzae TaxID=2932774 RepID=A0A9X1X7G7_9SPHI|nr:hypothetical protein [Mucilaginibacter straminoryzae]MCJ8210064.1 hypothetical protein [Mucilaginibacter straminoryzae]